MVKTFGRRLRDRLTKYQQEKRMAKVEKKIRRLLAIKKVKQMKLTYVCKVCKKVFKLPSDLSKRDMEVIKFVFLRKGVICKKCHNKEGKG